MKLTCPVCCTPLTLSTAAIASACDTQDYFNCPAGHSLWFRPETLELAECVEDELYHWLKANPKATSSECAQELGVSQQKAARWIQYMRSVEVRP